MFTEDLTPFLDQSDFAVAATYDGATAVSVIFDAAYQEAAGIGGTNPVATGKASDFPATAIGKTLLVNGTTYTIRERQPLDDGVFVLLQLEQS